MKRFIHFLQYNNLVSIGFFVLFGTTSWALAQNDTVRDSVYSSEQEVVSIDNTYLLDTNLKRYDFNFRITKITEDDDQYYVTYKYNTITVIDYVWQDAEIEAELTVSKKAVQGKDLGLYVAKQIGQVLDKHLTYLEQVQKKEAESGASVKVVSTKYKGLVGKMFDPKDQAFDGYRPVVNEKRQKEKEKLLVEAPFSTIALPPIPTSEDIQRMFEAMYQQMLQGEVAGVTATSTDSATTTDIDDDDEEQDDNDDTTATTTDPGETGTTTTPEVPEDAGNNGNGNGGNNGNNGDGNGNSTTTDPVEEPPVQEEPPVEEPIEPEEPADPQPNENSNVPEDVGPPAAEPDEVEEQTETEETPAV